MWGLVLFPSDSHNFIFIYISIKAYYAILHIKNAPHQKQMTILNLFRIVPDLLYSASSFTETSSPTQKLQELKGTCAFMKTGNCCNHLK